MTECHLPPLPPSPLTVVLPGAARLEHADMGLVLQPALAPLMPIFDIVGAISAIQKCLEAVTDPTALPDRLGELADKMQRLSGLVPQVAVPAMARSIVDASLALMDRASVQLQSLLEKERAIPLMQARADELGDEALRAAASCFAATLQVQAQYVLAELAPLSPILTLVSELLQLVGAPALPGLALDAAAPLERIAEDLATLRDALAAARKALP